jgi:Mg2+ and Co2+ transporter CorA
VQISEQKQLKKVVEELNVATNALITETKALIQETKAHKRVGQRMEESGRCMTLFTMTTTVFLPLNFFAAVSPSASSLLCHFLRRKLNFFNSILA